MRCSRHDIELVAGVNGVPVCPACAQEKGHPSAHGDPNVRAAAPARRPGVPDPIAARLQAAERTEAESREARRAMRQREERRQTARRLVEGASTSFRVQEVIERHGREIAEFPDLRARAEAKRDELLAMESGAVRRTAGRQRRRGIAFALAGALAGMLAGSLPLLGVAYASCTRRDQVSDGFGTLALLCLTLGAAAGALLGARRGRRPPR